MIHDDKPVHKKKRPIESVSFADLETIGIKVYVTEHDKVKPGGKVDKAVKVVKVTKSFEGKDYEVDRDFMRDTLWHLGIDTYDPTIRYWVTKKTKHRTLFGGNEPVYTWRFQGYERCDEEYLRSGRASEEAITFSSNMEDMGDVVHQMKNGGEHE